MKNMSYRVMVTGFSSLIAIVSMPNKSATALTIQPIIQENTDTDFSVRWSGNFDRLNRQSYSLMSPSLASKWNIGQINLNFNDRGQGGQAWIASSFSMQHIIAVHDNEGQGQEASIANFEINPFANGNGGGFDSGTIIETATHGNLGHRDIYELSWSYQDFTNTGIGSVTVDLTGTHVPEPLTILGTVLVTGYLPILKIHTNKRKKALCALY